MKSCPPCKVWCPELRAEQVADGFRSGDGDGNKADVVFRESVCVQAGPCWAGHSLFFMGITTIRARNYSLLEKRRVCSTQDYPLRGCRERYPGRERPRPAETPGRAAGAAAGAALSPGGGGEAAAAVLGWDASVISTR